MLLQAYLIFRQNEFQVHVPTTFLGLEHRDKTKGIMKISFFLHDFTCWSDIFYS